MVRYGMEQYRAARHAIIIIVTYDLSVPPPRPPLLFFVSPTPVENPNPEIILGGPSVASTFRRGMYFVYFYIFLFLFSIFLIFCFFFIFQFFFAFFHFFIFCFFGFLKKNSFFHYVCDFSQKGFGGFALKFFLSCKF